MFMTTPQRSIFRLYNLERLDKPKVTRRTPEYGILLTEEKNKHLLGTTVVFIHCVTIQNSAGNYIVK